MRKIKGVHKLWAILLCLVYICSSLIVATPPKTYASATDGENPKIEFEAFVAATYLKSCMVKATSEYPKVITGEISFSDADLFSNDSYFQDYDQSWLEQLTGDSLGGEIACTSRSDIATFVRKLGFQKSDGKDEVYTLLTKVYDCSKRTGEQCDTRYQGDIDKIFNDVVVSQMRSSGLLGPDNNIDLSNAAKYYGLRDAWSDSRLCDGKLANKTEYDLADSNKKRKTSDYKGISKFQYVSISSNKLTNEYDYALIETNRNMDDNIIHRNMEPSGKDANGKDWNYIDKALGSSTCAGILSDIVKNKDSWGKEYMERMAPLIASGYVPPDDSDSTTQNNGDSCESASDFGWLLCAGINLMSGAIASFENAIENQLEVVTPNNDIESAWSRVRTIALILLVPIMLVMVISTALGFDFIDAYTVKRTLPRLAIAVILITLSFALTKFSIDLFNTLGNGVKGLMLAPFGGEKNLNGYVGAVNAGVSFTLTGIVATGAFFTGIGLGVLFPLILSAAIGLFLGFAVLIIRQVVLFLLIITVPLAIVAWILPGTEKFWKLWWGNFTKLLFMYPLIMALIAAGKIGAEIIPQQQNSTNFFVFVLVLVAYIAPFFFIPATFKAGGAFFGALAGGVMGSFAGARKGMRDRATANRQAGWQRFTTGTGRGRLRNSNLVRRAGMGVGVGARGRFGFGDTGRAARAQLGQVVSDENLKNNARLQKLAFDDDGNAVMALSGGTRAGAEQASMELANSWLQNDAQYQAAQAAGDQQTMQNRAAVMERRRTQALAAASSIGFTRANAQSALSTLAQNKSRSIATGQEGRDLVLDGINRLHGEGSIAANEQRQNFAFASNQAGRGDLASSGDWTAGDASLAGFERTGLYQAANGDANGVIGARESAVALAGSADPADRDRAARHYQELEAMLPNTSGPVRDAVLQSMGDLRAAGIESHLSTPTGAIDPTTGNPIMVDQRVLYDSSNPTHATWSPEEVSRGWRNESRAQQRRDTLRSRSYRAPNPNEIP